MTKSNIRIDQLKDKEASYLQVECPYRTCPFQCKFCCSAFEGSYPFNDTSLYLENRWAYFQTLGDVIKEYNVEEIIVSGMTEPSLFPEYVDDMAMFCRRNGITSVIQTMDHSKGYGNYDVVAYSIRDAAQMDKVPVSDAATTRYTIVLSDEIDDTDLLRFIWRTKSAAEQLGTEWQMTIKYLAYTSNGHEEVDEYIRNNRRTLNKPMLKIMKENGVWVDDDCMNSEGTKPTYVFRQDGNLYDKWTSKKPINQSTCNLGGDTSNDCADCVNNIDYHNEDGECVPNKKEGGNMGSYRDTSVEQIIEEKKAEVMTLHEVILRERKENQKLRDELSKSKELSEFRLSNTYELLDDIQDLKKTISELESLVSKIPITEQEEILEEMWAAKVVADYEGSAEKEIFTFAEALEELGFTKDDLKEVLKNL